MSLFGKILAVLNILAAAAFVVLGLMDYAKREAWSYVNYTHDVAVAGVPRADKDQNLLSQETNQEWYGGSPVATQVEEVDRVHQQVEALVTKGDPGQQTAETARVLLPFARHYSERERLLNVRDGLASADAQAAVRKRLHDAFAPAVAACLAAAQPDPAKPGEIVFPLKFPQAFAEACHAESLSDFWVARGLPLPQAQKAAEAARPFDPSPAYEDTFVRLLPAKPENTFDAALKEAQKLPPGANAADDAHDRAEKFLRVFRGDDSATLRKAGDDPADSLDKLYDDTVAALHAQLKAQLDDLYDRAKNGPKSLVSGAADRLLDYQHAAIAHYLFNMIEVLHPEEADKGVTASPEYDRYLRVVGLRAGIQEIKDQAAVLKSLLSAPTDEVDLNRRRDEARAAFTGEYSRRLATLQDQAVRLHNSVDLLDRTAALRDQQAKTTKDEQATVEAAENELAKVRSQTDAALVELRRASDALFKMRTSTRDLLGENLDLERQIRDLEQKKH